MEAQMPRAQDAQERPRKGIDQLLAAAGWLVCDANKANIHSARGVAIREFPLKSGHGFADYLLYLDGKAVGVIEAKKEDVTFSDVKTKEAGLDHIRRNSDLTPRIAKTKQELLCHD